MKKITLVLLILSGFTLSIKAQTQTQTQTQTTSAPPSTSTGSNDYASGYIGFRFLPTFTSLSISTPENGVAVTHATLGYGFEGFIGGNFSRNVGLQLEVMYDQLNQQYVQNNIQQTVQLNYINIPLLLVLNTDVSKPINLNICFGPQIGINTGANIKASSGSPVDTVNAVVAVKPADFGVAYGAGIDIALGQTLSLDLGYRGVVGLVDISENNQSEVTNNFYILQRSHISTYAGYVGLKVKF